MKRRKFEHNVFRVFLLVRLLSVLVVQTYFVADEYYQSLEVAHNFVFGYGHLTWEWHEGLRSYGFPFLFAILYKVLKVFGLDSAMAVIYVPRIFQAVLSAYSDLCFYRWSGRRVWAVFTISTAWFPFYMGSRTLINTFEASLTTIALSKFPWVGKKNEDNGSFIWIVAVLFAIRPTCAVIWIPLCLYHLNISEKTGFRIMVTRYIPIGFIVLLVSTALDSFAHGSFIITPYNFLKINIFQDIATIYGSQPWHWYLSSGIPAILGIQILPFIMATTVALRTRHNHPNELAMLGSIIFSVFILSFLAHKEFRFIYPLMPMMLYVSSRYLSVWSRRASESSIWLVLAIILIGNALPAWYVGYSHQRGTLDVMASLNYIAARDPENASFLFLMPCHSTPLYSHIHSNVTTRFLTCNPNLHNIPNYVDEADIFYKNPNAWLRKNYPSNHILPSHIICFDNLIPVLGDDILSRYKPVQKFFHCDIAVSSKISQYVLLFERYDYISV